MSVNTKGLSLFNFDDREAFPEFIFASCFEQKTQAENI